MSSENKIYMYVPTQICIPPILYSTEHNGLRQPWPSILTNRTHSCRHYRTADLLLLATGPFKRLMISSAGLLYVLHRIRNESSGYGVSRS